MKGLNLIQMHEEAAHRVDVLNYCPEDTSSLGRPLRIFVPYTKPGLTRSALDMATRYALGLNARVTMTFVYIVPYPLTLDRPDIRCDILARRLRKEIGRTQFPLTIEVILARERNEALRSAIPAGSLVLLSTGKHWWRTSEEKLAYVLSRSGCSVSLVYSRASMLAGLSNLFFQHYSLHLNWRRVFGGNHA